MFAESARVNFGRVSTRKFLFKQDYNNQSGLLHKLVGFSHGFH